MSTRRAALLDDAVGGDLLARADDEAVADAAAARRRCGARPVGVEERDVLGAQLEQRLQRGAGAALGARLEVAAGEDERGHDRGRLEVDVVGALALLGDQVEATSACRPCRRRRGRARTATTARRRACRARSACPSSPCRGAGSPTRRGGTATRPRARPAWRAVSASHCQLSNCSAGIIETSSTGSDEQRREDQPAAQRRGLVGLAAASAPRPRGQRRVVAGGLDRADERSGRDRRRVVVDGRLLGRVVDARAARRRACSACARSGSRTTRRSCR